MMPAISSDNAAHTVSEFQRGDPQVGTEEMIKISDIRHSYFIGNFSNGFIGIEQKVFCAFEPLGGYILGKTESYMIFKQPAQRIN